MNKVTETLHLKNERNKVAEVTKLLEANNPGTESLLTFWIDMRNQRDENYEKMTCL